MVISRIHFSVLCLQGICIAFNVASISAMVPQIAQDFSLSGFVVGRINWAYMLPYGLVALVWGPLTRRFEAKYIAVVTLGLFSLFSFLSGVAQSYEALFVARFCVGIFACAITPLVLIYLADRAKDTRRGKYVGVFFSATFIASLAGLFLSGILSWRTMFFIPAVLALVAAVLTVKFFPESGVHEGAKSSRYIEALRQPEIFRVFFYIFLISFLYHGIRQWLGVYFAQELDMKKFFISMTLMLVSFAGVFGEVLGGSFSDKRGRVPTLKLGIFLMSISLFILMYARSAAVMPFLMLLWGFGWTVNHAALSAFLTDLNKGFMKEISSLNSSVRFFAGALGVMAGGWVLQKSFVAGFFSYGIILLAMFFFTRKILLTGKIDVGTA